jgi:hypothetical protein
MKSLFYIVALILILIWSIAFIGYGTGGMIHILLVLALISVTMRVLVERRPVH